MIAIANWIRMPLVAVSLFVCTLSLQASGTPCCPLLATSTGLAEAGGADPPAGSPELGILIIIGVVGLLVLIAWIFSRIGDDSRSSGDSSLV